MISIKSKKDCCGCYSCVNTCPQKCIHMESDVDGFLYPTVDKDKCVSCNLCNKACPMLTEYSHHKNPKAYGAINPDESTRLNSSSGGVFYLLCEYTIAKQGIVVGAAFDQSFNVVHTTAETLEECKRFMGSKYVQSRIGDLYQTVKQLLKEGRFVLFSGTPCQIAGLYTFLGECDLERLITQDIICHSVPSPKKWNEYKNKIGQEKQIIDICFRNKDTGWSSGSFVVKYFDGTEYRELYAETEYMKGFLRGDYSRPSCYSCKFSSIERQSDITLGDFWGVEGLYPKLYDNKGTSVVLINSKKGNKVFREIKRNLIVKRVKLEYAIKYNPAVANRDALFLK